MIVGNPPRLIRSRPEARMRARRVLIAGCGYLGTRAGLLLGDAEVYGLRRRPALLPAGLRPVAADLITGAGLEALPEAIDTLIYAPTPGGRDEASYRSIYVEALRRLLQALPNPAPDLRLIYVSSTAVYGQDAGEWVDEQSPAEPLAFNGRILLEGERVAATLVPDCVCVRLAGLYGPDRLWLINRVRSGSSIAAGRHYSNRIHIEDAAALVALLASSDRVPAQVIGVDDQPVPLSEVLDWLAAALGMPAPERIGKAGDVSGKRLRNDLAHTIGWRPRYASYRDGYTDVLTTNFQGGLPS